MSHRVYQQASFIGLMLSFLVVGCASGKGSSALLMVNSGGTAPAASQQPDVFEKDAKALIKLRGTYLCTRPMAGISQHGNGHSSWSRRRWLPRWCLSSRVRNVTVSSSAG